MQAEKTILEREAYPELREYSQKLGVELLIIDTHLPQSAPNPEDIIYRRREIRNCQNHSVGPNFVVCILAENHCVLVVCVYNVVVCVH